ncbi:hypothetical protein CRM22_006758 [Opisthorchis felineus]|uniref:MD-2-related lipid-recognition domain-containing protein n=1 Tax=Opisthorchis felineus TaxID=147828 RepID=A0A4S2LJE3_OPIFE|nr:hypothetical protein CRM22_006758 [Opisthorchis felineus]
MECDGQVSDSRATMPLEQTVLLVTSTFVLISARTLTYTDCDESTRSLGQAEVHSIIWGVAVPFALDTPEICGDVQPNCPLRPRDRCTYKKSIYIPPTHSRLEFTFRWRLKNSAGATIVCVEIPVRVE